MNYMVIAVAIVAGFMFADDVSANYETYCGFDIGILSKQEDCITVYVEERSRETVYVEPDNTYKEPGERRTIRVYQVDKFGRKLYHKPHYELEID